MLSSKINICISILVSSQSTVPLPYPNLTWLPSSIGVKLDNGVGAPIPAFAAIVDSLQ